MEDKSLKKKNYATPHSSTHAKVSQAERLTINKDYLKFPAPLMYDKKKSNKRITCLGRHPIPISPAKN